VRAVKAQAFGDVTPFGGYNGDEDQGQMGALGVLMALGLFDVEGGAALKPTYQITSPLFDRVTIQLNPDYFPGKTFTITTLNNQPENISFPHAVLARGGELEIVLGPQPSTWGTSSHRAE
jgi:putative alpha-1,2-mannosidase